MYMRVFPTRVGVDRSSAMPLHERFRFPHTRGGGPFCLDCYILDIIVFPTRVGVDRSSSAPESN